MARRRQPFSPEKEGAVRIGVFKGPRPKINMANRPTGVTVISIVGFILSILGIIGGIMLIGILSLGSGLLLPGLEEAGLSLTFFMALAAVSVILGLVGLAAFYYLLKMRKIGWTLVTVIGVISIIVSIASFNIGNIVSIIIWAIIIAYLWTKKGLFK